MELRRGVSPRLLPRAADWMVVLLAETGNPGGRNVVGDVLQVQCWIH